MLRHSSLLTLCLFLFGCVTTQVDIECNVPDESMRLLQQNSIEFMISKGYDTKCEVMTEKYEVVGEYGCGLYGNATYDAVNPRTGHTCPSYLDGGYWVIFDHETLKPKDIVLVAW